MGSTQLPQRLINNIMKLTNVSLLVLSAAAVNARFVEKHETDQVVINAVEDERFLIELSPGKTSWVTEEEKWELRRNGQNFMDITTTQDLGSNLKSTTKKTPTFPSKPTLQKSLSPLLKTLSKKNMQANLETFSGFHTRYYKSDYGRQSSEWLLQKVQKTISDSGADDDGSGTVTILEALRVLLTSDDIIKGKGENTVEFHWYSAEEGGLLGSQAIFTEYEKTGRDIKAMLQQDMTGFVQGTLDSGKKESVGVITDFVDPALTEFIKKIVTEYCEIPYVETKCGYACSDHASASKAGYPSAFVIESAFDDSDKHIHTSDDPIKYLSFDHMLQHARLTLGLVYELAFAKL